MIVAVAVFVAVLGWTWCRGRLSRLHLLSCVDVLVGLGVAVALWVARKLSAVAVSAWLGQSPSLSGLGCGCILSSVSSWRKRRFLIHHLLLQGSLKDFRLFLRAKVATIAPTGRAVPA